MTDEIGDIIKRVQLAIHTVPPGWPLSAALSEFGNIMESWAQHPAGREWDLVKKLDDFILSIEKRNSQ